MKYTEKKTMQNVPMAKKSRNLEVLCAKNMLETPVKKNALSPNAARGNAVAVPRFLGQFRAAIWHQLLLDNQAAKDKPVLIEA